MAEQSSRKGAHARISVKILKAASSPSPPPPLQKKKKKRTLMDIYLILGQTDD